MATDAFSSHAVSLGSPGATFTAVTPSNSVDLASGITRGVYVGSSGDLKINDANNQTVTFTNLASGIIHPIRASRIWADSTAGSIVAVY